MQPDERVGRAPEAGADSSGVTALALILAGAFALRAVLVVALRYKQTHDVRIFVSWAHLLERYGTHGLYAHVDSIDHYPVNYPPVFSLILAAVVAAYRALKPHGSPDDVLLAMLLKLPAIAADLALCALVFHIVRRWAGARAGLSAAAIAAFAPSTWPISAVWGQVDSLAAAALVGALALLLSRRYTLAWVTLAVAVLVKPLPLVVAPVFVAVQIVESGLSPRLLLGPALGVVVGYVTALPFAPAIAPLPVLRWLAAQFAAGQALTDATSVSAYNVWTAVARPLPDRLFLGGITLHVWGWLAFAVLSAATLAALVMRLKQETQRSARERSITFACFAILVALFVCATRMHERYILFALALAPLLAYCGRVERGVAATLMATFSLCVVLVLGVYEHNLHAEIWPLTHALSLVNIACLGVLAVTFWWGTQSDPATDAAAHTRRAFPGSSERRLRN